MVCAHGAGPLKAFTKVNSRDCISIDDVGSSSRVTRDGESSARPSPEAPHHVILSITDWQMSD